MLQETRSSVWLGEMLQKVENGKGVAGPRWIWESGRDYQKFHGSRGVAARCSALKCVRTGSTSHRTAVRRLTER